MIEIQYNGMDVGFPKDIAADVDRILGLSVVKGGMPRNSFANLLRLLLPTCTVHVGGCHVSLHSSGNDRIVFVNPGHADWT